MSGATLARFVLGRLLLGALLLFGVSAVVFFGVAALPGDAATQAAGLASPERVQQLQSEFGLTEPAWQRYLSWWHGVVDGSFGTSLPTGQPVSELLGEPLTASLVLGAAAGLIVLTLGTGAGIWAGVRPGSRPDRVVSTAALLALCSPEFVLATLVIVIFAKQLNWFPSVSLVPVGGTVLTDPSILVLPAVSLGIYAAGAMARLVRAAVRVAYEQPHVEAAVLAGIHPRLIVWRHVLPSAWGPIAQVSAQFLPYVLGGAVVVERVFGYPGVGSLLVDRVAARDEATVLTIVMLLSTLTVLGYVAADVCSHYFDRRAVGRAQV
ncbi:ABC transporter permease [Rhodococcus sp. NPDC058521]|uniref:ABC transporter permease n=1 Tax=Rhodococcus sp. NPDC058521 TaxID=3346536 RepID=UPI00364AA148